MNLRLSVTTCYCIGLLQLSLLAPYSAIAVTLKQAVLEVVNTHPSVQERINNFRATQQDLNIADAGYLPKLDLVSGVGYKKNGSINNDVPEDDADVYRNSLVLTQNLFKGFDTQYQVEYQKSRTLAAAYNYVEKANDLAFQMVEVYLNLLKHQALLQNAKDNVFNNEKIYKKVYALYVSGHAARSEIDKIQATLSLSRSNLTVQRNNVMDAENKFRRILGRKPIKQQLQNPEQDLPLPNNLELATQYAINNNPSMLVSNNNIQGAQALQKQKKSLFYPEIDLELSQNYNHNYANSYGDEDRFQAMVTLKYNFYNGGADTAEVQKNISKIYQEVERQREIKREVIEQLDFSWSAQQLLLSQLDDLYKYQSYSKTTLALYEREYELSKRSLLDLLAAQNDYFNAHAQIIHASFDQRFAQYRILDAMGVMVSAILGDKLDYYANVNLQSSKEDTEWELSSLPVNRDVDQDHIPDNQDICDNSQPGNNILASGCVQQSNDDDADGVVNSLDRCANTPSGFQVNLQGCPSTVSLSIQFLPLSATPDDDSIRVLERFARLLTENKNYHILITGHTDNKGTDAENMQLSQERAQAVKLALQLYGVSEQRMQAIGRGDTQPIADNKTEAGKASNRRIEIELQPLTADNVAAVTNNKEKQ